MKNYLSSKQINDISNLIGLHLLPIKADLQRITKQYQIDLTYDRVSNMNAFWLVVQNKLKTENKLIDAISKQSFATQLKEGGSIAVRDMLINYLNNNPKIKNDYEIICNFNPNDLKNGINDFMRISYIFFVISFGDLLEISDYKEYFTQNFGISSADKQTVKDTKRITDFFDNLFMGISNKRGIFQAIEAYYINNDLTEFHNKIHE